jgi:UDP-GlcNAc3NAcA epimerase
MKILTILGARPQFIKAAVVSRVLTDAKIEESIVHTGQHFDAGMSDVFFEEMGIPEPAFHLGVHGGGHGAMTGAMLQALEPLLQTEQPDWVLVYGDTNSTLAGALAAAKLHIPVAHVEAGLRSFNRRMPEEQNRIVTDHLSDLLLTPTSTATARLHEEGIPSNRVHQVGDVMFDAAIYYGKRAEEHSHVLVRHGLESSSYVLSTLHRAENTDDPTRLHAIINGLDAVARDGLPVVLPLHPRTRIAMAREGLNPQAITLIDPIGYLDMVVLERHAAVIATDSGGVQKEAYFHGVPCITLRDETEWVELVQTGWNHLVPADARMIAEAVKITVGCKGQNAQLYGDGNAARKVVLSLLDQKGL